MVDIQNLEIYKSIADYIKVVSNQIIIEKVYLFGSYTKGNYNSESDIDIAIISPTLSGNRFNDNVLLGKLTWKIDTRIEPMGFTPKSFSESIMGLEIKSTGAEIILPIN
ncbi:MAG: nucleotidyltransferase domain-containing protein [Melioribacteraceae bacterium]|nr:nucleotidyltransferase domain-containing protein [Melioribacteraceae bacterium]